MRLLAAGLVLAACAGRSTRYQGRLLGTHRLGADELRRQAAADPAVRDAIGSAGQPDFVLTLGPGDVELIWVRASRLVHFHRPSPGAPSETGVLSPLPGALLGLLPQSLQAGTPAPTDPIALACWRTPVGALRCQTCCKTVNACVGECRPATMSRGGGEDEGVASGGSGERLAGRRSRRGRTCRKVDASGSCCERALVVATRTTIVHAAAARPGPPRLPRRLRRPRHDVRRTHQRYTLVLRPPRDMVAGRY